MNTTYLLRTAVALLIILSVSGCGLLRVTNKKPAPVTPAGGLYKSLTSGDTWTPASDVYGLRGERRYVGYSDITFIEHDPLDADTLYMGTNNGLYYSYDRGNGWYYTLGNEGSVNGLSVDSRDSCSIFVTVHNKIYRTTTCGRDWDRVHFSSLAGEFFTAVHVSRSDSSRIFVGTSIGTLLESKNSGVSWEVKQYIDAPVSRIVSHPTDENSWYLVTQKFGIQFTDDEGSSWQNFNTLPVRSASDDKLVSKDGTPTLLSQLRGSGVLYDLKIDPSQENGLIYASSYGIFRLINHEYWQSIDVLNKPAQQKIYSVVTTGKSGEFVYFTTSGALYRSVNGGKDWTVKSLPATGAPKMLVVSPDRESELFVGIIGPQKK